MDAAGEWRDEVAARNSQAYFSNELSVNSTHISTHAEATQTLLT